MKHNARVLLPVLTASLLPMLSALAADGEDPAMRCAKIGDALERLVCYDRTVPVPVPKAAAAPAAPTPRPIDQAKIAEATKALEAAKAAEAARVAEAAKAIEAAKLAEAAKVAEAVKAAEATKAAEAARVAAAAKALEAAKNGEPLPVQPEVSVATAAPVATPAVSAKPANSDTQLTVAQITGLRMIAPFQYEVTLSNGETWRQTEQADQFTLTKGQAVRIKSYANNKFLLGRGTSGSTSWVLVARTN